MSELFPILAMYLATAVVVVVAGGSVLWQWWSSGPQVARRRLRAVQVRPAASLRPGEVVKVSGRVALREALESPLRGAACAHWSAQIREKVGKNSWKVRAELSESRPFWLEDASGRVYVDLRSESLSLQTARQGASGLLDDPGPREQALLERAGMAAVGSIGFNRVLGYHEASLDEGERVAVLGVAAVVEVDGEPALAIVPGPEGLVVSDRADVHE